MRLDFLEARDGCIQCSSTPPVCNCGANQVCFQIAQYVLCHCTCLVLEFSHHFTCRSCSQCSSFKCVDNRPSPNSSHAIGAGAIAGAVLGSLFFLALAVGLFLWWRRRNVAPVGPAVPVAKDIPAPADTVLNRPDPTEKVVLTPEPVRTEPVVRVYGSSNTTIDLDPTSQSALSRHNSAHSNPFGDGHSIQTTSTGSQSTNVIPIAFVPPPASVFPSGSTPSLHPLRLPGVDLNMDHMNFSAESVPVNLSDRSIITDDRSYITNASHSSDVLAEVPTIVTSRQVASAAKAAVVSASARSHISRPSIRSPLTGSSFGPQDVLRGSDENRPLPILADPFADVRSPGFHNSMATQGLPWQAYRGKHNRDRLFPTVCP